MSPAATDKRSRKAFDEPRGTTFLFDPDDLTIIGLDTDDTAETHALYDDSIHAELDEDDIKNMDAYGVISPISIVKRDGKAIVVAGRDRVRRAREVKKRQKARGEKNLIKVPCVVRNGDDNFLMQIMDSENESRRGPTDISKKIQKIQRMLGRSIPKGDVARSFRVSEKTIDNWLALGEASKEIIRATSTGAISVSAAIKLARLPHDEQTKALAEVTAGGAKGTTDRAARAARTRQRGDGEDGTGITGRKAQRRMLEVAAGTKDDEVDPYYQGAADALRLILGEKPEVASKAKKLIKGLEK